MKNFKYAMRADNVYCLDTKMFGFDQYSSSYLVKGKELALVDTGIPPALEVVRAGIKAHGFSVSDISYIFVSHCEHPDHSGNVTPLLKEATRAKVYINPIGARDLLDPSVKAAERKATLVPKMAARFGVMEPTPPSRIQHLRDGEVIDLGDGEKLRIMFTPGHQPSGMVIFEEKYKGLFINDLVGNYFPDADDFSLILTPYGTDLKASMEALKKFMKMPISRLFLGHFGIAGKPNEVMQCALTGMQKLMDIGAKCLAEGKPEELVSRIYASKVPETEKLLATRGKVLFDYITNELNTHHAEAFAKYYLSLQSQKPGN